MSLLRILTAFYVFTMNFYGSGKEYLRIKQDRGAMQHLCDDTVMVHGTKD